MVPECADVPDDRNAQLITAVATSAVGLLRAADLAPALAEVLRLVGAASNASRACVCRVEAGSNGQRLATELARWEMPAGAAREDQPHPARWDMAANGLDGWITRLAAGDIVTGKTCDLPAPERGVLASAGVFAILVVPIFVNGTWWGQVRLEDCSIARDWARGEIDGVKILAELIGAAVGRQERIVALTTAQRIIEGSPVIMFRFGPDPPCPLLYVSDNIRRYGHAVEDYLREPTQWYRLIPYDPADLAAIHAGMASIVGGAATEVRHRCHATRPDGVLEWFEYTLRGVFDSAGKLTGLDGIAVDITEHKQRMATQALLAAIVNSSGSAIIATTLDGIVTSWNAGAERLYGYSAAETIGRLLGLVVPPERRARYTAEMIARAHDTRVLNFDTEHVRKDGTVVPVSVTISPILDASGDLTGKSCISRDRTAQQQAADALTYRDGLLHAVTIGTAALIEAESVQEGIDGALRCLGESLHVDRVVVLQNNANAALAPLFRGLWEADGLRVPLRTPGSFDDLVAPSDYAALAAWRMPLSEGRVVTADRSSSEGAILRLMTRLQNRSTLMVPIFAKGVLWGHLGIDACDAERQWTESEIDTLRTFADATGSLFVRDEASLALSKSEARFRLFEKTAEVGIITIDEAGRIGHWNPGAARILGYSAADAVGRRADDVLVPERLRAEAAAGIAHFIETGDGIPFTRTIEIAALRQDATEISVEISLSGARFGEKWEGLGILRDVTERNAAATRLKLSNVLLTTEMEASPDAILVVNGKRHIISFNQRFADMWQVPVHELQAGDDDVVLARVTSLVRNPAAFTAQVEYLYDHPDAADLSEIETVDGRLIERHSVFLRAPDGENLGRIWFFHDMTEAKRAEALALRMAHLDDLTGLVNRSDFIAALEAAIEKAGRGEGGFSVLYLDLDHFKDINDTLGHMAGDALLQVIASRLKAGTGETDAVARFGGDKFAILAAGIEDAAGAATLAKSLITALSGACVVQGHEIHAGVSIGIDLYGADANAPETLLSHADLALYQAKAAGRATYRFFTDAMNKDACERVALVAELRHALSAGELFLQYQPQVTTSTGRVTGLEALVRWRHPVRGILGPDAFIPAAEQSGLIVKLGRWVLLTACQQARAWQQAGIAPLRISVNVSGVQFRSPAELEADILAALRETGLPPYLLELELTETVLMFAAQGYEDLLLRLRAAGITIAIDDFGTGYSSLAYLRRFQASRIKIPETFIKNLETDPADAAIVKAIIGLGLAFNSMVIAEGVETAGQLALLRQWSCGEVQGFRFSKPLNVTDATKLLQGDAVLRAHDIDAGSTAEASQG